MAAETNSPTRTCKCACGCKNPQEDWSVRCKSCSEPGGCADAWAEEIGLSPDDPIEWVVGEIMTEYPLANEDAKHVVEMVRLALVTPKEPPKDQEFAYRLASRIMEKWVLWQARAQKAESIVDALKQVQQDAQRLLDRESPDYSDLLDLARDVASLAPN